jgi:NADPH:quinone reductase-like Zn-dependent oxidoreductase
MTEIPKTMSGVLLTGHGGPEVLEFRTDLPVPVPAAGEVLVRVTAAGVNNTDINTRLAWYSKSDESTGDSSVDSSADASWSGEALQFPRIQGADVCGEITATGPGVDPARQGERVLIEPCLREAAGQVLETPWYLGSECDGGFAGYTTVAARHAYSIDSTLSDVELASFPCSYSTAENMLTRASVTADDTVLITGASGGVGSAAVQLARARSAEVVAVTSASKAGLLRDIGAGRIVHRGDNLEQALGRNSVDVVIDLVAGPQWGELLDVLRPGGRYAVSGAIGGPLVELDIRTLYLKDLSFFGCTVLEPEAFGNLVRHIEAGRIKPLVAESWDLREINKAQASFVSKKHTGNIVLRVAGG